MNNHVKLIQKTNKIMSRPRNIQFGLAYLVIGLFILFVGSQPLPRKIYFDKQNNTHYEKDSITVDSIN